MRILDYVKIFDCGSDFHLSALELSKFASVLSGYEGTENMFYFLIRHPCHLLKIARTWIFCDPCRKRCKKVLVIAFARGTHSVCRKSQLCQ